MRKDTQEFIKSGDEDLEAAKELFKLGKHRIAAFHCQQAVEKYLKAYLLEKKGNYPFTHLIYELIEQATELNPSFQYLFDINVQALGEYYTGARYPPLLEVSEEEAREALEIAVKVREFVIKKLKEDKEEQHHGGRS